MSCWCQRESCKLAEHQAGDEFCGSDASWIWGSHGALREREHIICWNCVQYYGAFSGGPERSGSAPAAFCILLTARYAWLFCAKEEPAARVSGLTSRELAEFIRLQTANFVAGDRDYIL